ERLRPKGARAPGARATGPGSSEKTVDEKTVDEKAVDEQPAKEMLLHGSTPDGPRATEPDVGSAAPHGASGSGDRFFASWVRTVTRFPALTGAVVVAGLTLLTLPATGLRLALPDAGALPQESSARQTYDLVSEH